MRVLVECTDIQADSPSKDVLESVASQGEVSAQDLYPVKYWLCSIGANGNNDYWSEEAIRSAYTTIELKPININHDRHSNDVPKKIVGVNYASEVKVNSANNKLSILAKAVIYKYLYKDDKIVQLLINDIKNGTAKASMECIFTQYTAVHPETGEYKEFDNLEELERNVGLGNPYARCFIDPEFTSSAFLVDKDPADKDAVVEAIAIKKDDLNKESVHKMPDDRLLGDHKDCHMAYTQYKEYGKFGDWSLPEIKLMHRLVVDEMLVRDFDHSSPLIRVSDSNEHLPVMSYQVKEWLSNAQLDNRVFLFGGLVEQGASWHDIDLYATVEDFEVIKQVAPDEYSNMLHLAAEGVHYKPFGRYIAFNDEVEINHPVVHLTQAETEIEPGKKFVPVKPYRKALTKYEVYNDEQLEEILPVDIDKWIVSEKIDGNRCIFYKKADQISCFSDAKNDFNLIRIPHIVEELNSYPNDFVLDGELVVIKNDRPTGHSDITSFMQTDGEPDTTALRYIKYVVFDVLYDKVSLQDKPYEDRLARVKKFAGNAVKQVKWSYASKNNIKEQVKRVSSYEGVVIRAADSTYFDDKKLFKMKYTYDLDVGVLEKKETKAGTWTYLCAVRGQNNKPYVLGWSYHTSLAVDIGDVLIVTVDHITLQTDTNTGEKVYSWYSPKVYGKKVVT